MIAKFRYHSEKMCIAKISQGLRHFRYGCEIFTILAKFSHCIAKILLPPALPPAASISSIPLDISSSRLDEITENSYEHGVNQHQHEAKLGMIAEVPKTCKTIKNNLETKSMALTRPAHVNWLNSYD